MAEYYKPVVKLTKISKGFVGYRRLPVAFI